jgi:hypothetical protein
MRAEYDFTGAVRGKYYDRFTRSSNVLAGKGKRVVRRPSPPSTRRKRRRLRKQYG